MPKRSIRERFLAERKALQPETRTSLSDVVQGRFLQSESFQVAGCLALYSAIYNEVLTEAVALGALAAGKRLAYPRVREERLEFVAVNKLEDLLVGAFGVLEPQGQELVPVQELEAIVVPGVVFDRKGHRLGYGRGFYDRALNECQPACVTVGFAYDFQLVDSLPIAEHDQRLSRLVTESRELDFIV